MFLKAMRIKRFRSICDLELNFNNGLNVLIGENNAGKTAVIDALRICLSWGSQYKDIYVTKDDFYIDKADCNCTIGDIEFGLTFEIENQAEKGIFIDLLSQKEDKQELSLHYRYYLDTKSSIEKVRYKIWGGDNEGQSITPEVLELIYFIYLGALRNAVQDLKPSRGNRIGQLFCKIESDKDNQKYLANRLQSAVTTDASWQQLIVGATTKVNEHLANTTITSKSQQVHINFLDFEFKKIVESLRIQIPVFNSLSQSQQQSFFDIYLNGLGYNNLIYTATTLGDIVTRKELEPLSFTALLIEEPEAHLHPQLQNILFNYFNSLKGSFQVFITSHSPTITSKADIDCITILQNQQNVVTAFSLAKSKLDDDSKKYLQRFLDVTKSQLFFAEGVILVEGISEALLLPTFADIMSSNENSQGKYNLIKNGIELVNINGVAFKAFADLFNADKPEQRLKSRCVIITDDDRNDADVEAPRAKKALDLEGGLLSVELGKVTFEYELFILGNNSKVMLEVYKQMHPLTIIETGSSIEEYAVQFVKKLKANKDKAEFAQRLVAKLGTLEKDNLLKDFKIPNYIQRAIKKVVVGEMDA